MDLSKLQCPQHVDFTSSGFLDNCSPEDSLELARDPDDECVTTDLIDSAQPKESISATLGQCNMEIVNESLNNSVAESCASYVSEESKENFQVNKPKVCDRKPALKPGRVTVTVPKSFKFHTDDRIKSKEDPSEYKEENFQSKLRQNIITQTKPHSLTKVQPFHLTEGKKRKHVEKYKSMAEEVAAFQKTPDRFHGSTKGFQPQEHWEPPPLTAKSPQLQAVKRRRLIDALSKEEQEEKEVQEMKSHVFHAKPLNHKIYGSCKPLNRSSIKAEANERKHKFKARPIPKNILSGPVGLGEKKVKPPTAPKSPIFEVESRLEKRKLLEDQKSEVSNKDQLQLKVKKTADGPPPIAVPWTKRCTSVEPFSFDRNDKERFLQKEKKIQEIIESETKVHVFHAQHMPSPAPAPLPAVPKKPITVPEPFNFHLEGRSSGHRSFMQSMNEEKEHFKAQPATVLVRKPFVPKPCPKPEIEIQEFHLNTEKRAEEKEQMKQLKEAQEREREQALQLLKAQEEERERQEIQKLRSELVHKAQPIHHFKPIEIKPSSVPLTQPQSPEFETKRRLQSHHEKN